MKRIFISYRRDDSAGHAGRLFDFINERLGADSVFMDVDGIEPGVDFVVALERALADSEIVLVMIGRRWLDSVDAQGRRRLENPDDFVRLEIATALQKDNVRVVPVLVQDAVMPRAEQLPDDLKKLVRRNAVEVSDTRWSSDCELLLRGLQRKGQSSPAPAPTPVPVPVPPPVGPGGGKSRAGLWAGLGALLLAAIGVGYVAVGRDDPHKGGTAPVLVDVPKVVGSPRAEAEKALAAAGFTLGAVTRKDGATADVDRVLAQTPPAGGKAERGSSVALTVGARGSAPPALVVVPDLQRSTLDEARARLGAVGLAVGNVERRIDDSVAPGTVIGQDPQQGSHVKPASQVALVVAREQGERISAAVEPASHDFGAVETGKSGSRQFELVNDGKTALVVGPIKVTGDAEVFDVAGGAPCAGRQMRIGDRCAFEVRFAPTAAGRQSASVEFSAAKGARLATLALSGEGRSPAPPPVAAGRACRQGWVWREAFIGDYVCVTPAVRAQVAADNAQRAARIDPVNHAYGPATCRAGFVWRVADTYLRPGNATDLVCVTPQQRDQAAADNNERENRWVQPQPLKPNALKVDRAILAPAR